MSGQEPINADYYKEYGDEYRAHCDGECNGGRHRTGARLATSLTYCEVAERGGYTLFTRSGLKVVPRRREMLFFGYKNNHTRAMDHGHTEHTGCPLREGKKWIATQWYRDGVSEDHDWSSIKFM
jgi:prolyl 4-hydroxylase